MFVALLEGTLFELLLVILSAIIEARRWQMANIGINMGMKLLNAVVRYFKILPF